MALSKNQHELRAPYEEVIKLALNSRQFKNRKEIQSIILNLITKGILEDKLGSMEDKEIEYFIKYGATPSIRNRRVLTYVRNDVNDALHQARMRTIEELFYPK